VKITTELIESTLQHAFQIAIQLIRVCIGCDFSSAKVVDRGVADRHVVDGRVPMGV
jgi:hypothetical protein